MEQTTRQIAIDPVQVSWARAVSHVLSPPVVWALLAVPIAYHGDETSHALLWALLYSTLVCLIPVLYIAWNVRNGNISDLHMKERRERFRPFVVTILGTALACLVLWLAGAPRLMPLFALFTLLQMIIMGLITVVWQISIHSMSISSAAVALGGLYGATPLALMFPLIVLVGVARYKLRRHTLSQIVAGAALGASVTLVLFLVL